MSSSSEAVRNMLLAHMSRDEAAFQEAAREYIAEERRKRHAVLARDLEGILCNGGKNRLDSLTALGVSNGAVPRDKDHGLVLVEVREARRDVDSLVLTPSVREVLDRVIEESRRSDVLRTYGLRPMNKVLFCGPPGCGKTVAAEAVAHALYLPLVLVRFDAVISSYLGETASNLRKVFDFARSRPMVLFFDEFDAVGKERAAEEEHGELKRVVTSLLQMMDSFRGDALTIAASNHQGLLDSALWRRFDEIVYFDRPDPQGIEELLLRNLRQIGLSPQITLATVAGSLSGMTHADVERVALDAAKETILSGGSRVEPDVLARAVIRQQERRKVTEGRTGSGSGSRSSIERSTLETSEAQA